MRLSLHQFLLYVIFCVASYAHETSGQAVLEKRVTLNVQEVKFKKVLQLLGEQANVKFVYSSNSIDSQRKVTLTALNQRLDIVLEDLLNPYAIEFAVSDGKMIMLTPVLPAKESIKPMSELNDQVLNKELKGRVVDEQGEALPGVSILVKGTQQGQITDVDGRFSIEVTDENVVLVFSFVGYITQEIEVGNRTSIEVSMQTDQKSLEEVVVVGYGTQKIKDLTGAVATLDQSKVKDLPVSSIDQKLVGQIAGVRVQSVSGIPGGGSSIKIRGTGSIGAGNQPLYVIDGMPYSSDIGFTSNPLSWISPSDIESISVLKDASSTAIYGSRGANGVIIVTTKKGSFEKTQIQVSAMSGIQNVPQRGRPALLNQREFAETQIDRITKIIWDREKRKATLDDFPAEYRNLDALTGQGTDWYDLILRQAKIQDYNIGISRGSATTKYSFNLGYFDQEGVVKYTGFKRYSAKLSVDSKLGKKIMFGASVLPSYSVQAKTSSNTGREDNIGSSLWLNPVMKPYDENGNLIPYINSPFNIYKSAWSAVNPLFALRETKNRGTVFQNIGNVYGEIEILKSLKLKSSFNSIIIQRADDSYVPKTIGGINNPPNASTIGRSNLFQSRSFNFLNENILTYNFSKGDHNFDALIGNTAQSYRLNSISLTGSPFTSDVIKTINAAQTISSWGQDIQKWTMLSYLSRVNYSYKHKYMFTGTIRRDGSSRFGSENRYANFPSVAVAWRASQEEFLKNFRHINDLKLRASLGKSGNNNIGNYSHIAGIRSGNYLIENQQVSALSVGLGNPLLTWEESLQFDFGIDLFAFNEKVSLTLDYYRRKSVDMLISNRIPVITGFSSQTINIGSIQNQGLEINLGLTPFSGEFKWISNFNMAINRNKILSLNDNDDPVYSGSLDGNPTHITMVGKPVAQFFGYVFGGLVSAENLSDDSFPKSATHVLGGPTFKDLNSDGVINPVSDFAVLGNPHEKFYYGFTNMFSYKNFDFSAILNGQHGGKIINGLRQTLDNVNAHFNLHKEWVNRWRSAEDPGDGYHSTVPGETATNAHVMSNLWLENASFLRISNMSLGYKIPEGVIQKMNIRGQCRFYLTAQNLVTFTRYKGANPEAQASNQSVDLAPGIDMASYPLSQTFSMGVNLSF